ncbi:hypothetical protein [Lacticaseibacillus songhuajiangensis]|jgi:hypothetical protein|uniref:hypothetical protein n=1 Tax=Lacticaseibacillus songhuajiangensis TaxID=1296539 RepID=UPI000F773054|nr:hypothetical protein [Lacticaseibacillus songhuajiangensis]
MPTTQSRRARSTGRITKRQPAGRSGHPGQRRFAAFMLTIVAIIGIGIAGLKATALNENYTTQTLTTGENLTAIETQVQKAAGSSLTDIPGASTLVSRTISADTTKALTTATISSIYNNTSAQIDFTTMDKEVKSAISSSTGMSSTVGSAIASSILPTLHDYFNKQLSNATLSVRSEYQTVATTVQSAILPLVVIAVILAIWMLVAAGGLGRFLHGIGWVALLAGLLGAVATQLASKLPNLDTLSSNVQELEPVIKSYIADVVNHISGYYLIAAAAGLVVLLVTIPWRKR